MASDQFPEQIRAALTKAASTLGESLLALGYPNAGKDAVFAEANLITHVAHGLMSCRPQFHCYAEAAHTSGRRIDLLASDERIAVAVEAKKFGDVETACSQILLDMDRLDTFKPLLSPLADESLATDWWSSCTERWALLIVGSHVDDAARAAWVENDPGRREFLVRDGVGTGREEKRARRASRLLDLLDSVRKRKQAAVGAESICPGARWKECQDAWLLWGAYRLE